METEKGRLFRRKDGKYLIYVPLKVATDSMFPFRGAFDGVEETASVKVQVSFKKGENKLTISPAGD